MKPIDFSDLANFWWFHHFLRVKKMFAYPFSARTDVISRIFGQKCDRRNIDNFYPIDLCGTLIATPYLANIVHYWFYVLKKWSIIFVQLFRFFFIFDVFWSIQNKRISPCFSSHRDLSIGAVTIPNGRYKLVNLM